MKTKIFFLMLIFSNFFCSQTITYKIEFDNSQYFAYMSKYYELKNQNLKKENAEHIKHYGEKYTNEVDKALNFFNENSEFMSLIDRRDLKIEIGRLQNFGLAIYDLLILLEKDELTVAKSKYTIEGAFEELSNSINYGKLFELNKKVAIMHAIEVITKNDSNEQIEQIIKNTSGLTADNLKDTYYNIGENKLIELNLTYRDFIKEVLKGILYDQKK